LLFSLLTINVVYAAGLTDQEKQEQNRRSRQDAENQLQRKQEKDVFLEPNKKIVDDTSLPKETPSFLINAIQLEGNQINKFPWAQTMLEKYQGRQIGMQGINLILKRLNNAFINRGYVTTRVLVAQQDLTKGVLRLTLVPGVIREIRFKNPGTWGNWQMAFPIQSGDILNIRRLEQGLEQMKRVPSQDVDMEISPGEKPGESDVLITVKRQKNWKLSTSMDDAGTKPTGKLQASHTLAIDNPFSINDLFNVAFNNDLEHRGKILGTEGSSIYYSFPYGNSTFTISQSHSNYHQTVTSNLTSFVSSGESDTAQLSIRQLLYRDQTQKTHLEFEIIKKESHSYIDDTEIQVQYKNVTAAKIGIAHKQYFGKAVFDGQLASNKVYLG
jgi:hemolysin activation/secretion protein